MNRDDTQWLLLTFIRMKFDLNTFDSILCFTQHNKLAQSIVNASLIKELSLSTESMCDKLTSSSNTIKEWGMKEGMTKKDKN